MTSIFSAIVPVMLIILVGYLAGYTFLNVQDTSLSKSRQERASIQIQTISQLTLYILYPALIFDSFYQTNISIESATGLLIGFFVHKRLLSLLYYFLTMEIWDCPSSLLPWVILV